MNYRILFLLAAFGLSAIMFVVFATWRRPFKFLFHVLLAVFSISASAQNWSSIIDSSRAVDWSSAGFTIPNYTTSCSAQPSITANSQSAAAANATSIQNALNSCDATHNVVNIPAGTYYITGINFPDHGKQVLRGAGANATNLVFTSDISCNGPRAGICMSLSTVAYNGSQGVLPPGGTQQCAWTGGYVKGSTSITLSSCGGTPTVNQMLFLDQANDTNDTNGVYVCDSSTANCTYNSTAPGNHNARVISGITHSEQQLTYITGVTPLGGGSYTVTISPGVYFSNIRSGQAPGAWWPGQVQNDGIENLSLDGSSTSFSTIMMDGCYQCWVKGVKSVNAAEAHIYLYQSANDVVRDSYLFKSQTSGSDSYGIDSVESSAFLIENNIIQQTSAPIIFGQASGAVVAYNFSIDNQFYATYNNGAYSGHNAGNEMNLWEGNNFAGLFADDAWGSSSQQTYFRNMVIGWQSGRYNSTFPILMRSYVRDFNLIGNVLGQPGYQNNYQSYATSTSGGANQAQEPTSIYTLGWANTGANCSTPPLCDSLVNTTLLRWGNWDVVTNGTKWDSTEASPAANAYVNANFSSPYFSSLSHTLPASLYQSSKPSWWPSGKAWPIIGPDVSTGNLGMCSGGSYAGAQATSSGQCSGGSLAAAWGSHVTSVPAQDCYLNAMGGPPDGTGSALSFNANTCYSDAAASGAVPGSPTALVATVN